MQAKHSHALKEKFQDYVVFVKVLISKPDNLSSIPRTHVIEENHPSQVVFCHGTYSNICNLYMFLLCDCTHAKPEEDATGPPRIMLRSG